MTAFTSAKGRMRAQVQAQVEGQGSPCQIRRLVQTTDASGHKVSSYQDFGTLEIMWLQPISGSADIQDQGLNAETTHFCYQAWQGQPLVPKDQVLPTGEVYAYDVIKSLLFETHRRSELKQVLRI